jgi:hypothetical protein
MAASLTAVMWKVPDIADVQRGLRAHEAILDRAYLQAAEVSEDTERMNLHFGELLNRADTLMSLQGTCCSNGLMNTSKVLLSYIHGTAELVHSEAIGYCQKDAFH